jgi:hypothetical protein
VRVINANNTDSLMSMLTEDVVFLAANDKPVVAKPAVRAWADGYLEAFHANWDKPVQEFIVSGDYAFERYSYTSTDTPVGGGKPVIDTGWGWPYIIATATAYGVSPVMRLARTIRLRQRNSRTHGAHCQRPDDRS